MTDLIPPMYSHQKVTALRVADDELPGLLIASDTGTGKTRSVLEGFKLCREQGLGQFLYVLAPLSILQPAWGDDIERWTPELSYSIAYARNRKKAFEADADVYITNHDAVKALKKDPGLIRPHSILCIDEATAYKNHTSQRSKAVRELAKLFDKVIIMSGTINSNKITDVWHPMFLVDRGERLGRQFFGFRSQVCTSRQVGPDARMVEWVDKENAHDMVAALLEDITVRYRFEDCIDIPEHSNHTVHVRLPNKLMKQYLQLKQQAVLEADNGEVISAIHAGAKTKKLLQLLTGAVYDGDHEAQVFHTDRYKLVLDLINEREQCVVAFNWRHEREQLCELADKEDWDYAIIDGSVSNDKRIEAVKAFQAGKLKVIFAHPQSAGHGLTLTKGTSTIWASPTYNAEHYKQFNARIYRAGQTRKTETIHIAAENTEEEMVYDKLAGKLDRMANLMEVFTQSTALREGVPNAS